MLFQTFTHTASVALETPPAWREVGFSHELVACGYRSVNANAEFFAALSYQDFSERFPYYSYNSKQFKTNIDISNQKKSTHSNFRQITVVLAYHM